MFNSDETPVASPCVGICRVEGKRCVGCHRTLAEIGGWSLMSAAEQSDVVRRCGERSESFRRPTIDPNPA